MMGRLGRDTYRRRLERLLSRGDDSQILQLVWAVHALQSDNGDAARRFLVFPMDAETTDLSDKNYIYPWNLETVVNELLATPKAKRRRNGRRLHLRCDTIATMRQLANDVRKLENAEDGISLEKGDIFAEMHRSIQRQFEWQRGFFNLPRFYRSMYLYGSGKAAKYFEAETGLAPSDFMRCGFALYCSTASAPIYDRLTDLSSVGVSSNQVDATLQRLSISHDRARDRAKHLRHSKKPTAYRISLLRDFPMVAFGDEARWVSTPLPPLILQRITSGLYLDVVSGGSPVWNEIGVKFQTYCTDYLGRMMSGHEIGSEFEYGPKKRRFRTPDILVKRGNEISLAVECKAKRMTIDARFSDDPLADATAGYREIAKGIFQIWRFFSHARRGMIDDRAVASDCLGMVLTLDPWLSMAKRLQNEIYSMAAAMAAADDPEITADDRRRVAITLIDDVEYTLQTGNERTFVEAVREITVGDKIGWLLQSAHVKGTAAARPYPFEADVADILPWWGRPPLHDKAA